MICCIHINSAHSLGNPSAWPGLQRAKDDRRAVPWVLLENVRPARLPREDGGVLREACTRHGLLALPAQDRNAMLCHWGLIRAGTCHCLLLQVEALLDRHAGEPPVMQVCAAGLRQVYVSVFPSCLQHAF